MRSSELARLAGVTVRTLRHYHQIGLLAEPPRTGGDYRDYDVHDLVRVLRIKRLAALGLPLQNLPALLDGPAATESVLEELDRELAEEISRLSAQREAVALLRLERAAPDLPPEFARYSRLLGAASSSALGRFDREQLILLSHLAGEKGMTELARLYDEFSAPELVELAARFSDRFDALDDSADPAEIERLVDETTELIVPVLRALGTADVPIDLGEHAGLLGDLSIDLLTPTQLRTLELLEQRLTAALA